MSFFHLISKKNNEANTTQLLLYINDQSKSRDNFAHCAIIARGLQGFENIGRLDVNQHQLTFVRKRNLKSTLQADVIITASSKRTEIDKFDFSVRLFSLKIFTVADLSFTKYTVSVPGSSRSSILSIPGIYCDVATTITTAIQ